MKISITFENTKVFPGFIGNEDKANFIPISKIQIHGIGNIDETSTYLICDPLSNSKHIATFFGVQFIKFSFVNNEIAGINLPLFDLGIQSVLSKGLVSKNLVQTFTYYLNNNLKHLNHTRIELNIQESSNIFYIYRELLDRAGVSADPMYDFNKEIKLIIQKLIELAKLSSLNLGTINFFLGLSNFFIGEIPQTKLYFSLIRKSERCKIDTQLINYSKRILHYISHIPETKNDQLISLIPSSFDSKPDIKVLDLLDINIKNRHDINISYPEIEKYSEILQLVKDQIILNSDIICFMGHGNNCGIQVILKKPLTGFLLENNLFEILMNCPEKKKTIILLSCEGESYKNLITNFCKKHKIENTINFVYCIDSFSFQKMELFLAGFVRGLDLRLSFKKCVKFGEDLIDFRGMGQFEIVALTYNKSYFTSIFDF